jgi:cell division protein FtsL
MSRLNLLLLIVLVLSGLMLVHTAYESRRLFAEMEKTKAELARLDADHARLLAERHAQATNLRVERLAKERLRMVPITPAVTLYVNDAPRAASSAGGRP